MAQKERIFNLCTTASKGKPEEFKDIEKEMLELVQEDINNFTPTLLDILEGIH
jgi:hypothetical protein